MVMFTGISVRTAAGAVGAGDASRRGAWPRRARPRHERGGWTEDDDDPTDPFGRTVASKPTSASRRRPIRRGGHPTRDVPARAPTGMRADEPTVADRTAPTLPSGRPSAPLEMRSGPDGGGVAAATGHLLKARQAAHVDEDEVDAGRHRPGGGPGRPRCRHPAARAGRSGRRSPATSSSSAPGSRWPGSPPCRRTSPTPWPLPTCASWPPSRASRPSAWRCPTAGASWWPSGDVLSSPEAAKADHPLEVALGRDIAGRAVMVNLAEMPHILVSGATGVGQVVVHQLAAHLHPDPGHARPGPAHPGRSEAGRARRSTTTSPTCSPRWWSTRRRRPTP